MLLALYFASKKFKPTTERLSQLKQQFSGINIKQELKLTQRNAESFSLVSIKMYTKTILEYRNCFVNIYKVLPTCKTSVFFMQAILKYHKIKQIYFYVLKHCNAI